MSDVAKIFTSREHSILSDSFEELFGKFDSDKSEQVAKAFQDKIEYLIENEK